MRWNPAAGHGDLLRGTVIPMCNSYNGMVELGKCVSGSMVYHSWDRQCMLTSLASAF